MFGASMPQDHAFTHQTLLLAKLIGYWFCHTAMRILFHERTRRLALVTNDFAKTFNVSGLADLRRILTCMTLVSLSSLKSQK